MEAFDRVVEKLEHRLEKLKGKLISRSHPRHRNGGTRSGVIDRFRPVRAEIDLDAVRDNAALLKAISGRSSLCAVIKADGYGHGALPVARAAIAGGATWLAVALVEEASELRDAGIDAPILLLSEPPTAAMAETARRRLVPTLYTRQGVEALGRAVAAMGGQPVEVHLKVDTGMHRVGADPADLVSLAPQISEDPGLHLGALWTHLAVADGDDPADRAFTEGQLARFDRAVADLIDSGTPPAITHVANSAAAILVPAARRDMVRCGIALYGVAPSPAVATLLAEGAAGRRLAPVLSLRAQVAFVRQLDAGARPSYGRRRALSERSTIATVPIGYADGVPRRLFDCGGEVLIGGVRRPLAGVVTMDQIVVDCGPIDGRMPPVRAGDEVVLIGRQGEAEITASEWARRLGTIAYEVLCGIGPRVPRMLVGGDVEPPGRPTKEPFLQP
jgi:alanine racemase